MKNFIVKYLICAVVVICSAVSVQSQEFFDCIYFKDGSIAKGKIIELLPERQITFTDLNDSIQVFKMDRVEKTIKIQNPDYDLYKKGYIELGVTAGTPAWTNFVFGAWLGPLGIKISGYTGEKLHFGLQLECCAKISDNQDRTHSINFLAGGSNLDRVITNYLGLAYTLNYHGVYFQAGFAVKTDFYTLDEYKGMKGILQIGYVHRFW